MREAEVWEVLILTSPTGSPYPLLSVGCEGMRRVGDQWTVEKVLLYE